MRTIFLDLETTGLDPRTDEIVEIGILDEDGQVLLDTVVRPERHRSWLDAQRVHGIAPAELAERRIAAISRLLPELVDAPAGSLPPLEDRVRLLGELCEPRVCRTSLDPDLDGRFVCGPVSGYPARYIIETRDGA